MPVCRLFALSLTVIALLSLGSPHLIAQDGPVALTATAHPPLPSDPDDFWLAPISDRHGGTLSTLGRGVAALNDGQAEQALALLRQPLADPTLADYRAYYEAVALVRSNHRDDGLGRLTSLAARQLPGYLSEAVRLQLAETAESSGGAAAAATQYEALTTARVLPQDDVWMRVGRARLAAGDRRGAGEAFARVYFEFPFGDYAAAASAQLTDLNAWEPLESGSSRYVMELGRAERLFGAKRYAQARESYASLQPVQRNEDRELIGLRLAECDHYLKRYDSARHALEPWTREAKRLAEARFFYLTATRELGEHAEYERLARELIDAFPTDSWAEEALNNLATHYILVDDDTHSDAVFREILQRFPAGRHAQRASWKVGWTAYREGRHEECATRFEQAAAAFPRSDYRPPWIYWAARARDQLGDTRQANRLYGILVADYLNSYYGRLASQALTARQVEPMTMAAAVAPSGEAASEARPASASGGGMPTAPVIRALIGEGLYDDALSEVQWAQKSYGDSVVLQATAGLIYARKGDLRRGINAVRRAYPQFLAAGGEDLPRPILEVIFPVAYWGLIQKYAPPRGLDPYLVAALMAQESTFDAGIRSGANAIGLMQVLPSAGRQYARRLHIQRFSADKLTDPEVNLRIGTAYFADLIDRLGGVHYALASYNAGPSAVARWIAERPGIARDEFIDDIPYPETQNYVKRILGTTEDYRRLYSNRGASPTLGAPGVALGSSPRVAPAAPASSRAASASKASASKKKPHAPKKKKKRRR
jgi:soluble lytic murein transglycosylase